MIICDSHSVKLVDQSLGNDLRSLRLVIAGFISGSYLRLLSVIGQSAS